MTMLSRYLEFRLAYRSEELAYGGLKPETIRRLERLGEELDGGDSKKRSIRVDRDRPITGTRLLRDWQGVEQIVPVTADGFEWQRRPYKSLSAIARAITGTRWNGRTFFGLPLPDRAAMDESVDQTKTLVGALGWDLFRKVRGRAAEQIAERELPKAEFSQSPRFFVCGVYAPLDFGLRAAAM